MDGKRPEEPQIPAEARVESQEELPCEAVADSNAVKSGEEAGRKGAVGGAPIKAKEDPVRTAVHEAGHALVAFVLGRPVHEVSIRARGRFAGICKFQKGKGRPTDDWVDREMQISLAGIAAEIRHLGKADARGAQDDLRRSLDLATERSGHADRAERLMRRMLDRTLHLLDQPGHWPAVLLMMSQLIEKETISGRAVRHLVEESIKKAE